MDDWPVRARAIEIESFVKGNVYLYRDVGHDVESDATRRCCCGAMTLGETKRLTAAFIASARAALGEGATDGQVNELAFDSFLRALRAL